MITPKLLIRTNKNIFTNFPCRIPSSYKKYHIGPLISLIDRVAADSMTERSIRSLSTGNNALSPN